MKNHNINLFSRNSSDDQMMGEIRTAIASIKNAYIMDHYLDFNGISSFSYLALKNVNLAIINLGSYGDYTSRLFDKLNKFVPECKILLIVDESKSRQYNDFLKYNADSYLRKNATDREVIFAVKQTLASDTYISSFLANYLLKNTKLRKNSSCKKQSELTLREIEVLRLIYMGSTYAQIAESLKIKYNTVSYYTKSIYSKMQVNSKNEAVYQGIAQGILEVGVA